MADPSPPADTPTPTEAQAMGLPPALPGASFLLDPPGIGRVQVYAQQPAEAAAGDRPILLVHSVNAAASAREMRPLYERLSATHPTYALDLPGFGRSEHREQLYLPRLMTDAIHAVVGDIRPRHGGAPVDVVALSLSCEFLARSANERPGDYRTVALVSPTGMNGRGRRDGPPGATRGIPAMRWFLTHPWWSDRLYGWLTRPGVIRYFLQRTWGGKDIDEDLWAYDVELAKVPGAKHAPFSFLSGYLFSKDVTPLYEGLVHPVWMSHGVRGDFTDYRGKGVVADRSNWRFRVFETGALPHFEVPEDFVGDYRRFLEEGPAPLG